MGLFQVISGRMHRPRRFLDMRLRLRGRFAAIKGSLLMGTAGCLTALPPPAAGGRALGANTPRRVARVAPCVASLTALPEQPKARLKPAVKLPGVGAGDAKTVFVGVRRNLVDI
jgi:hypothetical protein